jgi:DNA-binding FadR family transcriptional regulator
METAKYDIEGFIEADVLFHRTLLRATHDERSWQVGSVAESAVRTRLIAQHRAESLTLHRKLADEVSRRSPF